jgi:hypothetical protein
MCFVSGTQWRQLRSDVNASRKRAFAEGTQANFRTHIKTFLLFCIYFACTSVPVSVVSLEAFIQFLSRSFRSVQSIKNYVNSVKILHLIQDAVFPNVSSWQIRLLYRGISRVLCHSPKRALPITPIILLRLHPNINTQHPLQATLWSLYLITFFLFARKSNMVPPSISSFDKNKHLQRKDIVICDVGLIVVLKWSKTNQYGQRRLRIPIVSVPNSPLCPVSAYKNMLHLVPAPPSSPAFVYPSSHSLVSVTHHSFTSHLRHLLSQSGFSPQGYSGHSFRRGGATWAFRIGVPGELIQLHGDWRSDAYKVYLEVDFSTKVSVSASIRKSIISLHR